DLLARYKPWIGDWDAFLDVLVRPKPTCIVANSARLDRDRLAGLLAEVGADLSPVHAVAAHRPRQGTCRRICRSGRARALAARPTRRLGAGGGV
ncbi:hypothetical protein, partial [Tritonibacter sp. SIMBA_163]|uniref:hypothetical protein n=1 Tax=Tritonibacter sp. SIMBA_163 TaxID=3080868 RepID=UPI0039816B44